MKAALTVLSERGSANVTLDDIAKAAGFSKGGITYYYSSKEALIKDVFEYFFESVYQKSKEEIAKHKDPLNKFLSFSWLLQHDEEMTNTIYPLLFDILVLAAYNDDYRAAFKNMIESWVKMAVDILEEGRKAELFKIENSYDTAKLMSAITQGIGTRWFLDRENHSTEWAVRSFKKSVTALLNIQADQITKEQS